MFVRYPSLSPCNPSCVEICSLSCLFFFNATPTTELYTLSLHDALPILGHGVGLKASRRTSARHQAPRQMTGRGDRKSTRLNSSHTVISYAVFCLKKKKKKKTSDEAQIVNERSAGDSDRASSLIVNTGLE